MYFFQFLYKPKINCLFFSNEPHSHFSMLINMPHSFSHRLHDSNLFLSYFLSILFGGLHAYFDKNITTLVFLNWIKNDHDNLEYVNNYIGYLNKNEQYTLNYLDSTNMDPISFQTLSLKICIKMKKVSH